MCHEHCLLPTTCRLIQIAPPADLFVNSLCAQLNAKRWDSSEVWVLAGKSTSLCFRCIPANSKTPKDAQWCSKSSSQVASPSERGLWQKSVSVSVTTATVQNVLRVLTPGLPGIPAEGAASSRQLSIHSDCGANMENSLHWHITCVVCAANDSPRQQHCLGTKSEKEDE